MPQFLLQVDLPFPYIQPSGTKTQTETVSDRQNGHHQWGGEIRNSYLSPRVGRPQTQEKLESYKIPTL